MKLYPATPDVRDLARSVILEACRQLELFKAVEQPAGERVVRSVTITGEQARRMAEAL